MKKTNIPETIKQIVDKKSKNVRARLFVTRDDGITVYDSTQDKTTSSVAALVSGVWQASEALIGMIQDNSQMDGYRMAFDTSSQGMYLFPLNFSGRKYLLGAIYSDCLNPGQLKRQIAMIKEELVVNLEGHEPSPVKPESKIVPRDGFLFQDISDEEIDRLFSVGGI